MSEERLERAIAATGKDTPPKIQAARQREMIQAAMDSLPTTEVAPGSFSLRMPALGLALALGVLLVFLMSREGRQEHAAATPSELRLATGDLITSTPGARMVVESASDALRSIRLEEGSVLFDVTPLGHDQRFVVSTPDSEVIVRGTVFTVQVIESTSVVRVYEGKVEVVRASGALTLLAGQQAGPAGLSKLTPELLAARARQHAELRAAAGPMPGLSEPRSISKEQPEREAPAPPATPAAFDPDQAVAPKAPVKSTHRRAAQTPTGGPDPEPVIVRHESEGQMLLARGDFEAALQLARDNGWPLMEGDALRAMKRFEEAVAAYGRPRSSTAMETACVGAYLAAKVEVEDRGSPARAMPWLEKALALGSRCPLRERTLALTMDLAQVLGQHIRGKDAARLYLAEHGEGAHAAVARGLLDSAAAP